MAASPFVIAVTVELLVVAVMVAVAVLVRVLELVAATLVSLSGRSIGARRGGGV